MNLWFNDFAYSKSTQAFCHKLTCCKFNLSILSGCVKENWWKRQLLFYLHAFSIRKAPEIADIVPAKPCVFRIAVMSFSLCKGIIIIIYRIFIVGKKAMCGIFSERISGVWRIHFNLISHHTHIRSVRFIAIGCQLPGNIIVGFPEVILNLLAGAAHYRVFFVSCAINIPYRHTIVV